MSRAEELKRELDEVNRLNAQSKKLRRDKRKRQKVARRKNRKN
jgi:hypothetical protein